MLGQMQGLGYLLLQARHYIFYPVMCSTIQELKAASQLTVDGEYQYMHHISTHASPAAVFFGPKVLSSFTRLSGNRS
jgi:hypothetical protein